MQIHVSAQAAELEILGVRPSALCYIFRMILKCTNLGALKRKIPQFQMAALLKWTPAITKRGKYSKCMRTGCKVWDYHLAGGSCSQAGEASGVLSTEELSRGLHIRSGSVWERVWGTLLLTPVHSEMKEEKWSEVKVAQPCLTLQLPGVYSPWNSSDQNIGVGSPSLLKGIFLTQESNQGLLHCRWVLYQLSH